MDTSTSTKTRFTGCVKWFNRELGYGFITTTTTLEEVFVHYTGIQTTNAKQIYLVPGEYVEFVLSDNKNNKSGNENHKYVATDVTGIHQGKLMCETVVSLTIKTKLEQMVVKNNQNKENKEHHTHKHNEDHADFTQVVAKKSKRRQQVRNYKTKL